MIQPNELRLGNWVYDAMNDLAVKVIGIEYEHEHCLWEQLDGKYLSPCDLLNPIPLTEELIEKQGWEKFDSYYNNGEIKICKNEDWWHLYISDVIHRNIIAVDVKYLHELQNAYFVVTKKELEIKL